MQLEETKIWTASIKARTIPLNDENNLYLCTFIDVSKFFFSKKLSMHA